MRSDVPLIDWRGFITLEFAQHYPNEERDEERGKEVVYECEKCCVQPTHTKSLFV